LRGHAHTTCGVWCVVRVAKEAQAADPALKSRVQSQLRGGKGMLKVAAGCGVGSGTAQRIAREMPRPFDGANAVA
jgi:hypothetical protein